MIKIYTLILVFLHWFNLCLGQSVIDVEDNPYENVGEKIAYINDPKGELTFKEVEDLPDSSFKKSSAKILNGDTKGEVLWIKIKYDHSIMVRPYLVISYGNIDNIDIYFRNTNNKINHIKSGTFENSNTRAFSASEYIYNLPYLEASPKTVYIRLRAINTLIVPIKLVDGITLAKALLHKYVWQILSIGIAISLLLFNFFLWLTTKERLYGYYVIRIIFLFYFYVVIYLNGYSHFLPDFLGQFILKRVQAFAAVGFIATILFHNRFLLIKDFQPKNFSLFNFLIFLWVIIFIVSLWDTRQYTNSLAHLLVFITSIAILLNSISIVRKLKVTNKNPFIIFYALSWIPISLISIYVVLALVNVLPLEDYTFATLSIAGILEAILISLALFGDNIRILNKQKIEAEQESLRLITDRNAYLEEKISERTRELQIVNQKLQESNNFKDKLFSIIAHDMRSPLSSLKGILQLVDKDLLNPESLSRLLTRVRTNTEQVQKTMDNLLNWSISQMNIQEYQPELIDIKDFILEHMTIYEPLALNKGINCVVSCEDNVMVIADKNQLSLITRNLIDNAIKFTPLNGVINIGVNNVDSKVLFYVANSGESIPNEIIDRILDDNNSTLGASYGTAKEKGTGLGLQLCKEYIRNLKSELNIDYRDVNGEKSTVFSFFIIIPNDRNAIVN